MKTGGSDKKYSNRLVNEKSLYLQQHAHNPVDWFPWGEEAFARARRENKPIFLSVGYSTCHWCHVMERESFEKEDIAEVMNRHFINIKVDREERPDVDAVYMTFVQATTGSGGWPMSVWLTPELKPFVGGTYFPPTDRWGRPGFLSILQQIAKAWESDRERIIASGNDLLTQLQKATAAGLASDIAPLSGFSDRAYRQLQASYDSRYGGFGAAPKFPRPSVTDFLLRYYAETGTRDALDKTLFSLRKMAEGGIHDQVGGGFHRYSVDEQWHVPHFEKMLYDQGQLACTYLDAFQITHEPWLAEIAQGILDYVLRDMTGEQGQFLAAEDADSPLPEKPEEEAEGAFYLWQYDELEKILGTAVAAIFNFHYGVEKMGNVQNDPQGEFQHGNVLKVTHSVAATAAHFAKTGNEIQWTLAEARRQLLAARARRPRPHLDDKVITAWNGLMISAFARAAQLLEKKRKKYLHAATTAAAFIREHLYNAERRMLRRRYRQGEAAIDGYADDFAFLIQGLLDLYEASFDIAYLTWALELQQKQDELFLDQQDGGYFNTAGDDQNILLRLKSDYDAAEPSPNSISVRNLLRLARMTDDQRYHDQAAKTLKAFSHRLMENPDAMPLLAAAADFYLETPTQIIIAGRPETPDTQAILDVVRARFMPNKILMLADGIGGQDDAGRHFKFIAGLKMLNGQATAYLCENNACQSPTTDPDMLAKLLDEKLCH